MEKLPEEPVIVRVHPLLVQELNFRKEKIELKLGYKIHGGMPIISKLAAEELRQNRVKEKRKICINAQKRNGEKKYEFYV